MIGQQISLRFLVPRAIVGLEQNPLAEGDMYAGDLLHAVLRVDKSYWHANVEQWQSIEDIAERLTSAVDDLRDSIDAFRTQTF